MSVQIVRLRLADQAYELIRDRILDRTLLPGAHLSVPALAEDLQLSRSPIREAVQRLVHNGLCVERPHSGAEVVTPDLALLVDLYLVRGPLEGLSAHCATILAQDGLVDDLRRIQAEHRRAFDAGDQAAVIRADETFHARILAGAGSAELVRALEPLLARMTLAMLAGEPGRWPALALAEHEAVIDAVAAGDPERARASMEAHIARVRGGLQSKADDQTQRQERDHLDA